VPHTVLLVEDERDIADLVRYHVEKAGMRFLHASDGGTALRLVRTELPDVALLDLMLPGVDGLEVCRQLRREAATRRLPIIMLTARGEESERVRGLATGADDYIVKPFSVPELSARLRALLRRALPERLADVLAFGDLEVDREKKRVSRGGRPIDLGPTEYRLLEFLM
jgi:two-component system, OmpR family, phosphate regulon response regulator PhoB